MTQLRVELNEILARMSDQQILRLLTTDQRKQLRQRLHTPTKTQLWARLTTLRLSINWMINAAENLHVLNEEYAYLDIDDVSQQELLEIVEEYEKYDPREAQASEESEPPDADLIERLERIKAKLDPTLPPLDQSEPT